MNNDYALWILFSIFVGIALSIDLGLMGKLKNIISKQKGKNLIQNHTQDILDSSQESLQKLQQQQTRNALRWTIIWISLAGIFAIIVYFNMGNEKMLEFVTAYTLEKSLSVDNMFIFLLVFSTLSIPYIYQHRILSVGILSAIVFRILLVLVGVSLLESFHWMIYVFGGLLILTAIRLLFQKKEKKIDLEKNIAIRILKTFVPINLNINSNKFLLKQNGILYATPLLVALVIIELTDLLFAIDSIPAVLAISSDYFIVITSNIFAILGLRSLYLLLSGIMEKFYYLKPALVLLLFFIGFKMLISEVYKMPVLISLIIIFAILSSAIILSLVKIKQNRSSTIRKE
ncbi:MAG TPA: TerC/Alx family metal homeostasis membrane protein [Nitrososphaeraceae archaeon]|nr:TerC/Alx family metal homeostasis membrane protein [Nitrososphaeraceae archaeon]